MIELDWIYKTFGVCMELERVARVAFLVRCLVYCTLLIDDGYYRILFGGDASSIPNFGLKKDGESSGASKNRRNGMNKSCDCYRHFFLRRYSWGYHSRRSHPPTKTFSPRWRSSSILRIVLGCVG